jgi:hypothetical protein
MGNREASAKILFVGSIDSEEPKDGLRSHDKKWRKPSSSHFRINGALLVMMVQAFDS